MRYTTGMKRFLISAVLAASLTMPLAPAGLAEEDDGFSLMEEGAKLFMRGIIQEMEPAIEELNELSQELEPALKQMMQEMGPAFAELLDKVDDITMYHPPEMLPNGDIILRRKQPEDVEPPEEGGAIDL